MEDKFTELSDVLLEIINLLQEYQKTKDDYKKPLIRSYQVKLLNLGKIINTEVFIHAQKLNDDIDEYLANPDEKKHKLLLQDAVDLKNNLWEL